MPVCYLMKGPAGSGKSSEARKIARATGARRTNMDDIRAMIDNGTWSPDNEVLVQQTRDFIVEQALKAGQHVIVDDTNLNVKTERHLRKLAAKFNAEVKVIFMDTDMKTCIARDAARKEPCPTCGAVGTHVGAAVIAKHFKLMRASGFKVENPLELEDYGDIMPIEWIDGLPTAIICDLDGTLATMCDRSPYDWKACINDTVSTPVASVLEHFCWRNQLDTDGADIIILSGRDGVCHTECLQWFASNEICWDHFFQREEGDNRPDQIIKREIFDREIRGKYNVLFVLDDRPKVCRMWRELGLFTLQVGDPHKEF